MNDDVYRVKMLHRMTIAGRRYGVGEVILVPPNRLRVAAFWCRNGAAKPADAATARDVELFDLMVQALPVGVP